ncbi:MAG: hypothetical protein KGZ65_02230 [Sphingomonadales bacterium]|nr:hypothetical protein [Sphingomonadales bacterium]
MNTETYGTKVPPSFWIVTGLGLLWNAFGAYLYLLSKLDPETALAGATPAMRDYVATMPLWAHIGWSLGVWGSALGSVLMLVRSRHAVTAFLVSLLGALVSFGAQARAGVFDAKIGVTVLVVIAFLWWYCRNETAKGILR